jgi:23S rRNA (uridine2552-2'-O)-methyltransferase
MAFRPSAAVRSSSQWLGRHFRDPYVRQRATHPAGFRSRSAFKLLELDERYALVRDQRVRTVVDLGAAPGGWSQAVANLWGVRDDVAQVLADRAAGRVRKQTREEFADVQEDPWDLPKDLKEPEPPPPPPPPPADPDAPKRTLVALDLLHVQPIAGAHTIQADFLSPRATHLLDAVLQKHAGSTRVDVLLSDMAANATGNRTKDSEAALDLVRAVIQFADGRLETAHAGSPGGTLVCVIPPSRHPYQLD